MGNTDLLLHYSHGIEEVLQQFTQPQPAQEDRDNASSGAGAGAGDISGDSAKLLTQLGALVANIQESTDTIQVSVNEIIQQMFNY